MRFPKSLTIFIPSLAIQNVTETGEVTATFGVELDYIKLLAKGLGCSYKAYDVNVIYNHELDTVNGSLLIGGFPLSENYYDIASYPYASNEITFATEKPHYAMKAFAFLTPFSSSVWIALLLCILLASLVHYFVFCRRTSVMSAFFYISVTPFGVHHNWRPKSLAQNMAVLSWIVGVMFITHSYGSLLLSFLTVPVREKGITDIDDLYEAVSRKEATAVAFDNRDLVWMLISGNEKVKFLGEHILGTHYQNRIDSTNALQTIKPNVAVIGPRSTLRTFYGEEKYFIYPDSLFLSYYSVLDYTDDGFCCMERVNEVIHWIWAAGFNKKLYDDHVFKQRLRIIFKYKDLLTGQDLISPLSLYDMSGAFYFLITGHILGLICLICELFVHHYM